jgi:hypothetical protein
VAKTKQSDRRITARFKGMSIADVARLKNIPYRTLHKRIESGKVTWPPVSLESMDEEWDRKKDALRQYYRNSGKVKPTGKTNKRPEDGSAATPATRTGGKKARLLELLRNGRGQKGAEPSTAALKANGSPVATQSSLLDPLAIPAIDQIAAFSRSHSIEDLQKMMTAYKVQKERIALEKLEGSLVDSAQVEGAVEARFRADAESLLNWPAGVAADMAVELGVDERTMHSVLDKYVRNYMRGRSQTGTLNLKTAIAS